MKFRTVGVIILITLSTGCVNNSTLSDDVYSASDAKIASSVTYGTIVHIREVKIQGEDGKDIIGAVGGAVLGGFLGNSIGGGRGRSLATAAGAIVGGLAGQKVESSVNKTSGVELEIRKDDGKTIIVVQKQSNTDFRVGQRVAISTEGGKSTVSPR